MSEQDTGQHPDPSGYQQAAAQQGEAVDYGTAAKQAVAQVVQPDAAGETADAGASIAQMQTSQAATLSDYEKRLEDLFASAQQQRDQMTAQIEQMQRQLATTQAQVGPAAVQVYAESLAQRVRSLQAANPSVDLSAAQEHASNLAAAAKDVAAGKADVGLLHKLLAPIERHFTSVAPHIEGAATVVAEAGHLADEAAKIAAAA
jgi:hypothetical protein